MKLWTTILVCLSVLALGLTACDKKKDGEGDKDKGGSAMSAADICKKIGDGDKDCEAALGMLEKTLGDKLWGEFASCATKAENMEGSEKCMTKDMMAKLSGGAVEPEPVEPEPVEPKSAGGGDLTLDKLDNLKVTAPEGTTVKEMLGDQMLQGPGLVMTIGAGKDSSPKTAEDAAKDAEDFSPTNPKTEKLADGFIFTFENTGGAGTNYWLVGRRELGGKVYTCSTTGSTPEQQAAAVAACKSIKL